MPIPPEMYARSRAWRDNLAQRSGVHSRYLNADGSLARDVIVRTDKRGNVVGIDDYR